MAISTPFTLSFLPKPMLACTSMVYWISKQLKLDSWMLNENKAFAHPQTTHNIHLRPYYLSVAWKNLACRHRSSLAYGCEKISHSPSVFLLNQWHLHPCKSSTAEPCPALIIKAVTESVHIWIWLTDQVRAISPGMKLWGEDSVPRKPPPRTHHIHLERV